jgi:hypothetical protein
MCAPKTLDKKSAAMEVLNTNMEEKIIETHKNRTCLEEFSRQIIFSTAFQKPFPKAIPDFGRDLRESGIVKTSSQALRSLPRDLGDCILLKGR